MTDEGPPQLALSTETRRRFRGVLDAHGVEVGIVFGSATRPDSDPSDIDLAVSFSDHRPSDDGYSSVYFDLLTDLEDELQEDVDLVDVHSMEPRFARIVFDHGVLTYGSPDGRDALADDLGGERPSVN